MNFFESISSALSGIAGNKMRAALTMFGIIVGISSVIMITSLGQGVQKSIDKEFEEIGLDRVQLYTYSEKGTIELEDMLRNDDVEMLRHYDDIMAVSPVFYGFGGADITLLNPNKTRTVSLNGIDGDYFVLNKTEMLYGRQIVVQDVENAARSAVIDEDFAVQVFGTANCLGQKLKVNTYAGTESFTVIGIIKSNASSEMDAMYERSARVLLPITTMQNINGADDMVNYMMIKVSEVNRVNEISDNIVRLMEIKHGNKDKYETYAIASQLETMNTVITVFTLFLGFVAGISLFVGGIGVMNIMLVSVTERTREIGIRKSLGATGGNIQLQFLVEAVILTAMGGATGLLLGYLGGTGLATLASSAMGMTITPHISTQAVVLAVCISAAIGIIFGVYPAAKAAKLDPIEALRFE